jgi:steroid delta-isomerase-like uncharacterized protein
MKSTEVAKLNEQVIEAWNTHDAEKFIALCDDNVIWSINKGPETFKGRTQVKDYFNTWKQAFPDVKIDIKTQIAGEDHIAIEYEFRGTHKGSLRTRPDMPEIPPTNKKVTTHGCYIARIKNGKISEVNNYPDRLGILSQLGVLSAMHNEGV